MPPYFVYKDAGDLSASGPQPASDIFDDGNTYGLATSRHDASSRGFSHSPTTTSQARAADPVLYLQEPGTNKSISPKDIYQAGLGDCFLLSAIGEIARVDPGYIQNNMIKANANGTETVTLYDAANGQAVTPSTSSFTPVQVTLDNHFDPNAVNSQTNHDTYKGQQEIWPQVIEDAYANLNGGYATISNGGYDIVAMETLTGKIAQYVPIAAASLQTLKSEASQSIMEFDTNNASSLGYNLVSDHAYMFNGFVTQNHTTMVSLLNPWGTDEPKLVPWAQVAKNFTSISIGHV